MACVVKLLLVEVSEKEADTIAHAHGEIFSFHTKKILRRPDVGYDDAQNPCVREEKQCACEPKTWNEGTVTEEFELEALLKP